MHEPSPVVEYAIPRSEPRGASPLAAMILCLPGMICWCALLGIMIFPTSMRTNPIFSAFPPQLLIGCWAMAILFALVSLAIYLRGPKPWYVCINLAVNIAGLFVTGGVAGFIVLLNLVAHGD